MRLIDADALEPELAPQGDWTWANGAYVRDMIDAMPTVGGWISVKDRLPEIDERVLVFGVGKYEHFVGSTLTAITCMSDANPIDCHLKTQPYWLEPWQYYLTDYEITHWMPLPEPQKEDNDAEQ